MKVVGYVRVSTTAQAEEGFGLDVQRQSVRKWAKDHGHKLVGIQADEGISGAKELDDRPALGTALAMVAAGEIEGLVVPKLDRLARDLIIQETLLGEIRRNGGRVFSCMAGEDGYLADDPDDPSRKLIRQVLGAVSEYERSVIALRLRSGRRRKAEKGGYAYGRPPVGFIAVGKELVEDPDEQLALGRIRTMRDGGASIRQICAALDAENIPTKTGQGTWQPAVVGRILKRLPQPVSSTVSP
jgi:DNA invertase Pin-like site-specific DNA recombinase